MEVILLHNTPLEIADTAIGKCWDKCTDKPKERIERVGNKFKHKSTLEHVNYTFDIDGVSRALLQELARHRMQSLSVKSTRYTLKELKEEEDTYPGYLEDVTCLSFHKVEIVKKYVVLTGDEGIDGNIAASLWLLQCELKAGKSNDIAKYCMPEAYKTSLVSTMNMRALQNFLSLRTDRAALWEIQDLAHAMYDALPESHKFMFKDYVKEKK